MMVTVMTVRVVCVVCRIDVSNYYEIETGNPAQSCLPCLCCPTILWPPP